MLDHVWHFDISNQQFDWERLNILENSQRQGKLLYLTDVLVSSNILNLSTEDLGCTQVQLIHQTKQELEDLFNQAYDF